ncbi:MAG: NAD(+) synthase [Duncaniella sp.]|uniref:NAD(+) synthase n=1 Tax=Duncaniella sp. TaxID=2518496 RepID=UPI0023C97317|nr:NAD(+) synthase [Duncaniella sp.]MDE6089644.1 NAD(+) synthase [Duncaniella sp.]
MFSGFLRVAATAPTVRVADVDFNLSQIKAKLLELEDSGVEVAVFPEMCLTAYTCADLFHSSTLLDAASHALIELRDMSKDLNIHFAVGLPVRYEGALYNCAAFIRNGRVDLVTKTYIPNYNEFYERRWWRPLPLGQDVEVEICGEIFTMSSGRIFNSHGTKIGIEICEDLWVPVPPSSRLAMKGATLILNLSASDDLIGKYAYLRSLISQQSARCLCAYAYAGAGWGESSTDLTFDGKAIIAENGTVLQANQRWNPADNTAIADIDVEALERDRLHMTTFADCAQAECEGITSESPKENTPKDSGNKSASDRKLLRYIDPHPFVPESQTARHERCEEIINIQVAALAKRLDAIHCSSLTVGISGGLDSTLALLIAVGTFDRLHLDRKGIIGVTMPGFGTTSRTHNNAVELMEGLGVSIREISIAPAVTQHFKDIGHDPEIHDVTYENSQARQRTLLLMDIANQTGGIVLGTGDLSELALGWATYNGDHMSMYGVNAGVPKTLVKYLVGYFADEAAPDSIVRRCLLDIIDTPISPELIPADSEGNIKQKTEDLVGPYELHDFFLYYTLRFGFTPDRIFLLARHAFTPEQYSDDVIRHWLSTFFRRFFNQQFKRSCLPDGPKVGSVCLSPRGDWRMPSDASSALWKLH